MPKKITSSIKKFIWELQKFPMDSLFKHKIDAITNSHYDSANIKGNMLIIEDGSKTYTISMGKDTIEYTINYTDGNNYDNYTVDEIGKIYRCDKNTITKYLETATTTRYDYQETTTKKTISCFNEDLTEIFKSITTNCENYNEETGKKGLIQYEDRGRPIKDCNSLTSTKIRRTHNGNLIRIDELTHYVSSQRKYDSKRYSIRKSDEPYIQTTEDSYTTISEDLYNDYMNFRITEDELFKNFVKLKSSEILC